MNRAACGCLIEYGMILHEYDGPCADRQPEPTSCERNQHQFAAVVNGIHYCECGKMAGSDALIAERDALATENKTLKRHLLAKNKK